MEPESTTDLHIRNIPVSLYKRLRMHAAEHNVNYGEIVSEALAQYFKLKGESPKKS